MINNLQWCFVLLVLKKKTEKDGEIERLTMEASELHKSKKQLMELLEQRDLEISEKSATVKSYLDKIVSLSISSPYSFIVIWILSHLFIFAIWLCLVHYVPSTEYSISIFLKLFVCSINNECLASNKDVHLFSDYLAWKVNLTENGASKDADVADLESELGRLRATSARLLQVSQWFSSLTV